MFNIRRTFKKFKVLLILEHYLTSESEVVRMSLRTHLPMKSKYKIFRQRTNLCTLTENLYLLCIVHYAHGDMPELKTHFPIFLCQQTHNIFSCATFLKLWKLSGDICCHVTVMGTVFAKHGYPLLESNYENLLIRGRKLSEVYGDFNKTGNVRIK